MTLEDNQHDEKQGLAEIKPAAYSSGTSFGDAWERWTLSASQIEDHYNSEEGMLCTVFALIISLSSFAIQMMRPKHTDPLPLSPSLELLPMGCVALSAVCFTIKGRRRLSAIFSALHHVELSLFIYGADLTPVKSVWWTLSSLLVLWTLYWPYAHHLGYGRSAGYFLTFSQFLLCSLGTANSHFIARAASCLSSAFKGLQKVHPAQYSRQLFSLHLRLVGASNDLLEVYSGFLFTIFVATLLIGISEGYFLLENMVPYSSLNNSCVEMVLACFWAIVYYSLCFMLIGAFEKVKEEVEYFNNKLNLHVFKEQRQNIMNQLNDIHFYDSGGFSLEFSVYGFFKLNWRLGLSMVSATCTYLIILYQVTRVR